MTRLTARLATFTLIATTLLAAQADASAVQSYLYNTSGNIGGISPYSTSGYPINFTPESSTGVLTTPGTFVLGSIATNPLPTGATLTYDNTPFTIALNVAPVTANSGYYNSGYYYSSSSPSPAYYGFSPAYTYNISGVLNGSLSDGTSTLFPTITSITGSGSTPPFPVGDLTFNLQGIAAPVGGTYGTTTLTAQVDITGNPLPAPAPEPTSVAVFAAALAGWAWKRRRLAKHNAAS